MPFPLANPWIGRGSAWGWDYRSVGRSQCHTDLSPTPQPSSHKPLNPEDAYKPISVGLFLTRLRPPAMPGCTLLPSV